MASTPPTRPSSSSANSSSRSLVEIRNRLHLQVTTALNISAFGHLLSDLNQTWATTDQGGTAFDLEDRIDQFRFDWMCGLLSRLKPLDLGDMGQDDVESTGGETVSTSQDTDFSFVTASEGNETTPSKSRSRALPPDPVARGVLAEKTIKADLRRNRLLLDHQDYESLASVAKQATKKVLRTGHSVFVSPGLIESVDWTDEYKQYGWATPGIRWGVFKPDLIRFDEVHRRGTREGEEDERRVSWEVIELKYSGGTRETVYTNWKVQALFYHLSLARLLSRIPHLIPSHKVTFFISRNALSTKYDEVSSAIRTEQGHVEHHLFVLAPTWLQAVKADEARKLQDGLAQVLPVTPGKGALPLTFLEKLQQSVKSSPATPSGRTHRHRQPPQTPQSASPTKPRLPRMPCTSSSSLSSSPLVPGNPASPSKSKLALPAVLPADMGQTNPESPVSPVPYTFPTPDKLPPLPPVDEEEERLLDELFARVGIA
ncbi:hypothetical protein JCM11641_007660 [Rhodosporidiobolus odoratus]